MVSYLVHYDTLLQNATDITKCDSSISKYGSYYKMRRILPNIDKNSTIYFFNLIITTIITTMQR